MEEMEDVLFLWGFWDIWPPVSQPGSFYGNPDKDRVLTGCVAVEIGCGVFATSPALEFSVLYSDTLRNHSLRNQKSLMR